MSLVNEIKAVALKVSEINLNKKPIEKEECEIDEWYYKDTFGVFGSIVKDLGYAAKTVLGLDEYNEIDENILSDAESLNKKLDDELSNSLYWALIRLNSAVANQNLQASIGGSSKVKDMKIALKNAKNIARLLYDKANSYEKAV